MPQPATDILADTPEDLKFPIVGQVITAFVRHRNWVVICLESGHEIHIQQPEDWGMVFVHPKVNHA